MIIGNGLIANAFKNNNWGNKIVLFASGVSDSKTNDYEGCLREFNLLKATISKNTDNKKLIYFSTYSIDDPQQKTSVYVKHKLEMENYILCNTSNYLIIRTSNIVGPSANKNTIFNFLYQKMYNSESFDLWTGAVRNFIDIDDFVLIINELIKSTKENKLIYV